MSEENRNPLIKFYETNRKLFEETHPGEYVVVVQRRRQAEEGFDVRFFRDSRALEDFIISIKKEVRFKVEALPIPTDDEGIQTTHEMGMYRALAQRRMHIARTTIGGRKSAEEYLKVCRGEIC
jgi:hypothetical protein